MEARAKNGLDHNNVSRSLRSGGNKIDRRVIKLIGIGKTNEFQDGGDSICLHHD